MPTNGRTHDYHLAKTDIHATKWPPNRGPRKQVFVCGVTECRGPSGRT
ncbi:hypothetical protein HDF09_000949 [Edaphobacter lichenicola]|uniref:Uncharacterized protein n=1 Tax=Tunturiibacter empetritectus TaxID=3069691 RepID=A0A7W8IFK1_9BACT|nr:hypothetical protein [Edaphobacter lichenicola]